ncbi:MAG: UDP-N-acetylglucosamine--N-acetylmuramyl-(pentapeptide) pyrophosphoryl-undecaprenol N-acetylglucosamine transferase, partial [Planctomycetia bacterium]|nr:UDP-N-acetylglucosamine--N-acetylmuramyl-(pentapeptide) pyrophosphoryl-undecaprenol N-acetylglucosamine transferase [Planctomycetia bacterium]
TTTRQRVMSVPLPLDGDDMHPIERKVKLSNSAILRKRVAGVAPGDGPHVVFAGGGTAGHLFPGLAVAEELRAVLPQVRITFAGTGKEFERRHVARAKFEYLALPCRPLPSSAGQLWRFVTDNIAGYRAAKRFVREQHVELVVGLGGYASVPMGRAAAKRRVPLVLLEQNAIPGRATRALASSASTICLALAKAQPHLRTRGGVFVTGNPLRAEFAKFDSLSPRALSQVNDSSVPRRLLVLGGSGGSSQLNEIVPKALHKVRSLLDGWQVIHQSGAAQSEQTATLYGKFDLPATVVPFVANIAHVLRWTDLVVCRAGGTTLAELAAAGVPALLMPWAAAAGGHQSRNAEEYSVTGATITLDQHSTEGRLDDALAELLVLPLSQVEVRNAMAVAMQRMARPDATRQVVAHLQEILASQPQVAAA